MFDIGFSELLIVAVLSLIVMGPERLPETVRTISLWFGRLRQFLSAARTEIEDEVGIDEIRRQLHNEQIMRDLEKTKNHLEDVAQTQHSILPDDQKNVWIRNPRKPTIYGTSDWVQKPCITIGCGCVSDFCGTILI